jgi:hypothetical protein
MYSNVKGPFPFSGRKCIELLVRAPVVIIRCEGATARWEGSLSVQHIHAFLVHPGKGIQPKPMIGTSVPLSGGTFDLLDGIYQKSDRECDVDITFRPTPDGKQQNDCRDLVINYVGGPTLPRGRVIAERLALNTDGRSGLGLLFLIVGKEGKEHKLVLSRFPTDSAIYVDENPSALTVEFLDRVFMKTSFHIRLLSTGTAL